MYDGALYCTVLLSLIALLNVLSAFICGALQSVVISSGGRLEAGYVAFVLTICR